MKILLLALAAGHLTCPAEALCVNPPLGVALDVDELIDATDQIVLVEYAPFATPLAAPSPQVVAPKDGVIDLEAELGRVTEDATSGERTSTSKTIIRLKVVEQIKGESADYIYVAGRMDAYAPALAYDHTLEVFWNDPATGRTPLDVDCQVTGTYEAGHQYLVFVGAVHAKASEIVTGEDDRWLGYVRARIGD